MKRNSFQKRVEEALSSHAFAMGGKPRDSILRSLWELRERYPDLFEGITIPSN